ncbi:hypothetical protein BV330_00058 [Pseudomonas syringae pv. actinidiae]|uniref:STY4534 family ICE replication protein n=1 Tax=Pseudomonas syringae TaxID=317 RepID=UPI000A23DAFD|nr:STY4534 family ICE replication protein [Pseudomonas syringae]OSR95733.1 hypothetical protein BV330_00058 [Pseudomonas syringae pv. actinidiae]OSR98516.1 hypothetical protein BV331_00056 [Pseudomonas syringae pv. actinidiae]
MSNPTNESKFFDLHTTGIGYLNRIREVKPRKGNPFMAVTVAALKGSTDSAEYAYIDCNVVGAEADKLIRRCQDAVDAGKKVLVSFRIGDIWADVFTYSSGPKQGQTSASLKGRLLYISWIKVDGEYAYEAKPKDAADVAPSSVTSEVATPDQAEDVAPEKVDVAAKPAAKTPAKKQRARTAQAA